MCNHINHHTEDVEIDDYDIFGNYNPYLVQIEVCEDCDLDITEEITLVQYLG